MGTKNLDVLIIGGGITGASVAWHLARRGIKRLGIASRRGTAPSATRSTPGLVLGGQADNFTRVSHAHGREFAASLWRYGDLAFDRLREFCLSNGVSFQSSRFLRLITSLHELTEAERATRELREAGFSAVALSKPALGHPFGAQLLERVLAIQDDGARGAHADPAKILEALKVREIDALQAVKSLKARPRSIEVTLLDGTMFESEMVVCATHLAISSLIPELKEALVSVADQWSMVDFPRDQQSPWSQPGVVFAANHTYEWGVTIDSHRLVVGGGRYLRPMAGIEANVPTVDPRVTAHLAGQLEKTFDFGAKPIMSAPVAFLDCRPCDELPIIGPMFGESRILVATGYMGTGLALGFQAGSCLAELIASGSAPSLPRRLWPERLRSLES